MKRKYPANPYIFAIILGFVIPFIPEIKPYLVTLAIIFFVAGSVFGFLWPKESWRWGLWIIAPMFVLIGLSVALSGQGKIFVEKDLPILLLAITAACAGSFLFSLIKTRDKKIA